MKKSKTPSKIDLSAEAVPAETAGTALRLDSGKGGPRLSAAQLRFNRLLAKIDKLEGQVTEIKTLADAFRPRYHRTLEPLREAHRALPKRQTSPRLAPKSIPQSFHDERAASQAGGGCSSAPARLGAHGPESVR